jgi:chromosome segregation ATPase
MDAAPVPITAALSTSPDHPPPTTLSDVTNSRPSDADMFSPPRKTSSPIPKGDISQSLSLASIPGDISNLFNMSHDLDAIPQDGSVLELSAENELMYSDGSQSRGSVIFPSADSRNVSKHKRPDSTATITNANFYHTPQRTLQPLYAHSEASPSSIDNLSVPSSSSTMMENTTYHTPQTTARHASVSPSTTPLAAVASTTIYHTPLTSPEHRLPPLEFPETSSLLATLQAKLELQQDISMQYEADLSARDELVEVLQYKTDSAERTSEAWKAEGERRERKVERMRKRCKEWEAQCAWLTEQLERSREESFERSIFDEASGEALRMLHINIKNLEAAKANLESQARDLEVKIQGEIEAKSAAEAIVESLRKEIGAREKEVMDMKDREVRGSDDVVQLRNDVRAWRETAERLEREGIQAAEEMEHFKRTIELTQNNSSVENGIESLKEEIIRREQEYADLREGHRSAEFAWAEERVALLQAKEDALRRVAQLETENEELNGKDEELMMIKDELEAQWEHAEKASAEIKGLKNDIAQLRDTLEEVKAEKAELEGELYRRGEAEEEKENVSGTKGDFT